MELMVAIASIPIMPFRAKLVWLLYALVCLETTTENDLRQRTCKVIGRNLVRWVNRILDEIVGPLSELGIMVTQIGCVPRLERICQGHDDHVATLLEWHGLIVTFRVTSGVGVMRANVVHGVGIGIVSGFLDLIQRLQKEQQ